MPETLIDRVRGIIAQTQKIPVDTIKPDSTFADLKIDSLDAIDILFALESEFNINIPDDAGEGLKTVQDLATGIERLMGGEGATATA